MTILYLERRKDEKLNLKKWQTSQIYENTVRGFECISVLNEFWAPLQRWMNVPNTYKELESSQSDIHASILRPECQAQLLTLVFSEGSAGELSTLVVKACSHCRKANVKTRVKSIIPIMWILNNSNVLLKIKCVKGNRKYWLSHSVCDSVSKPDFSFHSSVNLWRMCETYIIYMVNFLEVRIFPTL